jgi:hypothetical protein
MAEQWEYKRIEGVPDENILNQLGAQGWELAGVVSDTGQTGHMPVYTTVTLIFKRRKP